jgi:GNAT superfamily N-acetyltransferase
MTLHIVKVSLEEILFLRNLYLQENNFQIRYNSRHERGWSDSYMVMHDEEKIGYGSLAGYENAGDRNTVFEFYIIPPFRNLSSSAFLQLLQASKAFFIECQSNDFLLTSLLYVFAQKITPDTILFGEGSTTNIKLTNVLFRKRTESDVVFEHKAEPVGNYVLELNNEVVATGGFFLHYNMPFADLYMEVKEDCRRKGLGSFLIQELKKQCYLSGRVPAARTGMENIASKATLIKAGLKIVGFILLGELTSQRPN